MGLEVITKPNEVKIPIDFQEVKIKVDVNILEEGEDQTNKFSHVMGNSTHSILFKTFPFSFMCSETRIYGDFWIREAQTSIDTKSTFLHGVTLYNLTSFFASMNLNMVMKNSNGQCETHETKTELIDPVISTSNVLKSEIIKEKLPNNEHCAFALGKDFFLNETITNATSNAYLNCEIKLYVNPVMETVDKSNLKSILCNEAISCLEEDKNFTLISNGQMFHFNKNLLSLISEVFGRMILTSNSKEVVNNSVEINDFAPDTIKAFQRVAFGNEKINDEDMSPELLMFAQKYLMKPLVAKIKYKIMDSLTNNNIFDIIKVAYLIDDEDMFKEACKYLSKNKDELKNSAEFQEFGKEHPVCMIKALTSII